MLSRVTMYNDWISWFGLDWISLCRFSSLKVCSCYVRHSLISHIEKDTQCVISKGQSNIKFIRFSTITFPCFILFIIENVCHVQFMALSFNWYWQSDASNRISKWKKEKIVSEWIYVRMWCVCVSVVFFFNLY